MVFTKHSGKLSIIALTKHLQKSGRENLRLIVMSATLEAEPVAKYLDDCPVIISEGKSFPVEIRHIDVSDERPVSEQAADVVDSAPNESVPADASPPDLATPRPISDAPPLQPVAASAPVGRLAPPEDLGIARSNCKWGLG